MRTRVLRWLLGALLVLAVAPAGLDRWSIPDAWKPWTPLDVAARPNALTRYKLMRLGSDADLCRASLATSGLAYEPVPDATPAPGCGFRDAVRITRLAALGVSSPFVLSCRAAVSLAMWERHAVLPAAAVLKAKPVRLEHLGSYACRNLYGAPDAERSRHATADALDVAGFLLAGGGRVAVIRHWSPGDAPEAVFLREIRNGACRSFDIVLGPDHNAAHRDHLHLDRGGGRLCR